MEQHKKSPYKNGGMFDGANHLVFAFAKSLRKNMTVAEKLLWSYLKIGIKGVKFRRQHPLGLYVADFYCHRAKLIIELDGDIHELFDIKTNDELRQKELEKLGYIIIRFTNEQVLKEVQNVLIEIESIISNLITNKKCNEF